MNAKSSVFGLALAIIVTVAAPLAAQQPTPDSQVIGGAATFSRYCRTCHGEAAKGDGPVAKYLTPKPADLTKIAQRNKGEFPAEAVHAAIAGGQPVKGHGTSEMPVWGTAFREAHGADSEADVTQRITELVAYLKSIQAPAAKSP